MNEDIDTSCFDRFISFWFSVRGKMCNEWLAVFVVMTALCTASAVLNFCSCLLQLVVYR